MTGVLKISVLILFVAVLAAQETRSQSLPEGTIEVRGLLKPVREVKLASRSQGVIQEIREEGVEVASGEVVLRLEDARERIEVAKQQRVLEMREFEGQAGKALDSSGSISRIEGMEKKLNHEVAKLLLAEANELLDSRRVVAPFSGVVTERMREVGEAVDEFVPVLTMVDLNSLYFEAHLPAARVRDLVEGQKAEISIDTQPGKSFPGFVKMISPVVNAASSEFKIRILLENSERLIHPGIGGSAKIFLGQVKTSAVQSGQN